MSRNSKKQSILCIIKNNFWILKLIKIYAPSLIVDQVIRVPVSVLGTFVSINFTRWIIDFVDQQYSFKRIVYLIIAIFSFFIITNLLYAISSIILIPQKQINLSAKIRENVIKKVSRINQIEFQKSDFFNIYTLGLNEIDSRPYKVLTTLFSAITSVISIFVVTGVTVGISAGFSILGIIAAVTDAGFGVIRQKYNYKQTIETTPDGRKRGYINRITYQPEFAEDLKVYPEFLNLLLERYRKATQSVKKIILKFSKKILLIDQFQQIPGLIFRQILPWVCIAYLLINKSITVSQATVLASTALTIPRLLVTLMSSASSFYEHSLYIDNLRNILNYKEDIERKSDKQIALKTPINFNIDDISFSYEEKEVLTHISLKITCGEKIAIVGYNGAGKSTLVKLLVRLYDVDNGEIFINDDNIKDIDTKSLRSKVAFLDQNYKIYSFSIAENILMRPILNEKDVEIAENALKKVGLYEKISSWEQGIYTNITREFDGSGKYLSGGEIQKLALARIYAGNYDCIILDESTSALDPISEDEIIRTIFDIFQDKTIVMISHRLVTVKYVDIIYFMKKGQLCEKGKHQELMTMGGEYSRFYLSQADKYEFLKL